MRDPTDTSPHATTTGNHVRAIRLGTTRARRPFRAVAHAALELVGEDDGVLFVMRRADERHLANAARP